MSGIATDRFCDLLAKLIKESGMTQASFYGKLGIGKAYFYDILAGKSTPPPKKQIAMIGILKPPPETCSLFFELAAKEREEVPADIAEYLDAEKKEKIRNRTDYNKLLNKWIKGDAENGKQ